MRVAEAADWLGVHRSTLYRAIARGEIPARRVGKTYIVSLATLERLVGNEVET